MRDKGTITVYWSPANFIDDYETSKYMLYADPEPLNKSIAVKSNSDGSMKKCPAVKDLFYNIYSVSATMSEHFEFSQGQLESLTKFKGIKEEALVDMGKTSLALARDYDYRGYVNLSYGMSWLFFSDEPLEARFTSPWFPPTSPAAGSMLTAGKFNIGEWLRPFNLEYLIPVESEQFNIRSGDPLFFLELLTNKKIIFKKFRTTSKIKNMSREMIEYTGKYKTRKSLSYRYNLARSVRFQKIIIDEIKRNLLD